MADIYDLSQIKRLVDEKSPSAVFIVDTNVVIKEPDFKNLKTSLPEPVFAISDVIILELEYLKRKPDSRENAAKAIKSITNLCSEGSITQGRYLEGVGWFISIPSPKRDSLSAELEQFDDIVKAFGPSDTKLLLLAKECNKSIRNTSTILLTGEYNLFNIVESNGIPSYLFVDFPMSGIEEVARKNKMKPIDWDNVLADVAATTKERAVEVELTLTAKRLMPKWFRQVSNYTGRGSLVIAEGYGVIHGYGTGDIRFLWTLPFRPYNLQLGSPDSQMDHGSIDYADNVYLDFLGYEQHVPEQLKEALTKKISDCTDPIAYSYNTPTVHDPVSVMHELLLFMYWTFNQETWVDRDDAVNKLKGEIRAAEGLENFWPEWFFDHIEVDVDKHSVLGEFINAFSSCWSIGDTVKLNLIL